MSLLRLKAECNNVLNVIPCHFLDLLQSIIRSKNELFVVSDLYDQSNIKGLLQVLGEHHRNGVPKMKCLRRGPSACVQIEVLFPFVSIKNHIQVPMAEEYISSEQPVAVLPC
jgi:hypothetical protein